MPIASVEMRLPLRSFTVLIFESFGTARTQRTGFDVALE